MECPYELLGVSRDRRVDWEGLSRRVLWSNVGKFPFFHVLFRGEKYVHFGDNGLYGYLRKGCPVHEDFREML